MSNELALMIALAAPALGAVLVTLLSKPPGLRDVIHIGFALITAGATLFLMVAVAGGGSARIALARPLPHVELAFSIEPLGALMATVSAVLSALHAFHTAAVVRAEGERAPARMMAGVSLASMGAIGVAFSANLFSFFVAYQALILATFPLVAHVDDESSRRAARNYLATLLAASIGLLLPAMVWTYALAGALDFRPGGLLGGRVDTLSANVLLALYVFGLAMLATPPLHRWLTISTGAPYPALVSIQALAVVPAGAVGLLKISAYVFGPALHEATIVSRGLLVLVGIAMCAAALIALSKQDLRERLAYSVMTQSMAVALGALLALPAGLFAATLQMVALMSAASTLMMVAGSVHAATGRRDAASYAGLGRLMPWTFAAFALGSASMVGMPPFSGAWAKLWLITAAADAGLVWAAVLAGIAAVLTFAHLGPLAASALAVRAPEDPFKRPDGAPIMLVAPVVLSGAATLLLLVFADPLSRFLAPLWSAP